MKANLKGRRSIKGLLLAHGEKAVIAVVGVCAAFFVWKSLGLDSLPAEQQHDRLTQLVSQTQQQINSFRWDDAPAEEIRRFPGQLGGNATTVSHKDYQSPDGGWNRPVVPPTVLRTDPVLLAAQELEVHGGSGLIALVDESIQTQRELQAELERQKQQLEQEKERQQQEKESDRGRTRGGDRGERDDEEPVEDKSVRPVAGNVRPAGVAVQGDERIVIAYWATVVAKVPVKEQLNRYKDVLENARSYDESNDFPEYLGYAVERAEVGDPGGELRWERVDVCTPDRQSVKTVFSENVLDGLTANWGEDPIDVIADAFYHPSLVFPLAPLVGRDWGVEVNHSDLPLAWEFEAEEGPVEEIIEESADEDQNMFGAADSKTMTPRRAAGGARPGGAARGVQRSRGRMMEGERSPERGGGGVAGTQRALLAPDYLLRFFDFNVEPGKRYKYRVQLALMDVNHPARVNRNDLDQTVWDRHNKAKQGGRSSIPNFRYTSWSEPSSTVTIPLAGNVRIAEARAASPDRHNDEPRIKVLVESFGIPEEADQPVQAAIEKEVQRGYVLNLKDKAEYLMADGRNIKETDSFSFHTDVMVVDIDGGEKLTRDSVLPARALLMDPSGRLFVRRELDDLEEVQYHRDLFAPSDRRRDGGFTPHDDPEGRGRERR